ncbi:MAG: lipoprotein [Spirochaetaceae bacterium]|nr:lipoprotein [Spirochaetaceae bacterium]
MKKMFLEFFTAFLVLALTGCRSLLNRTLGGSNNNHDAVSAQSKQATLMRYLAL